MPDLSDRTTDGASDGATGETPERDAALADQDAAAQRGRLADCMRENDRMLVGWLADKLGDVELARDVAQDAYLRIWRFSASGVIDNPKALLFKTAANLAANAFRARRRTRLHAPPASSTRDGDGADDIPSDAPSPERAASARADAAMLIAAIDALPDKTRRAFVMNRFEGRTYAEIADALGVSVSSIEKYIIAALKVLRATVDEGPPSNVVPFRSEKSRR